MQNLSALQMNEFIPLYHADDSMIDSLCIFVSLHHLLVQLWVRDFCANSDTTLYGFLNLTDHRHQLHWCFDRLGGHSTLSCI